MNAGAFLGYRDAAGNEVHCAHAKCLDETMCKNGCRCPIAKPNTKEPQK